MWQTRQVTGPNDFKCEQLETILSKASPLLRSLGILLGEIMQGNHPIRYMFLKPNLPATLGIHFSGLHIVAWLLCIISPSPSRISSERTYRLLPSIVPVLLSGSGDFSQSFAISMPWVPTAFAGSDKRSCFQSYLAASPSNRYACAAELLQRAIARRLPTSYVW